MKQITISVPGDKLDVTLKHFSKLSFIQVISGDESITLDKKQQQMLSLMLKGYSLLQIAASCKLNSSTVRLRRYAIIEAINLKHPDELISYIVKHDLLGIKLGNPARGLFTRLNNTQKKFLSDLLKGTDMATMAKRNKMTAAAVTQYKKDLMEKVSKGNPTGIIRYLINQNLLAKTTTSKDKHNKAGLSDREKEVLLLLLKGNSNAEIAESLRLSKRTVEVHRSAILVKTKTKKSIDLMGYAVKNKLVKL